jgi:hypothetical protein
MKYKIEMFYILDENTTFLYDKDCKKFAELLLNTGILIETIEVNLLALKNTLIEILAQCSKDFEFATVLKSTSFQVKVYELHGVNTSIPGFISNPFKPEDNVLVYSGMLSEMI